MDYCMRAYCAKNSYRQIKNLPIPTESQFAKFNARQIFPLYGSVCITYLWLTAKTTADCKLIE